MSKMSLMIGAPVFRREWIMEKWFDHVRAATEGMDVSFGFVGDLSDPTFDIIREQPEKCYCKPISESDLEPRGRMWDHAAYHKMVMLRNNLLEIPRQIEPTFFLSLDTDILVHPESIRNMIESADFYDTVGGKCYMTPLGKQYPSWGNLSREGQIKRGDSDGVIRVQIIMAMKLMTLNAYRTDYKFHKQGEDIGWCQEIRKQGMTIGWDGRVASKHVLNQEMLERVDPRVGF